MPLAQPWRRRLLIGGVSLMVVLAGATAAIYLLRPHPDSTPSLPAPGSPLYEEYVEAFQLGVAGLDADVPQVGEPNLSRAIELIPDEPAAWADRGLLYVRSNRFLEATRDLHEAQRLAPDNPDVEKLLGLLEARQQHFTEAATHLRRAVERDPHDVETIYRLATIIEQQRQAGSDAEYQRLLEQILAVQPHNLFVLLRRLLVAVRRSDQEAVRDTLTRLKQRSSNWPETMKAELVKLERDLADLPASRRSQRVLQFTSLAGELPGYQHSAVETEPRALPGTSLESFVRLAPVRPTPAPPDMELAFTAGPVPGAPPGRWDLVLPVWLTAAGPPAELVGEGHLVFAILPVSRLNAAAPPRVFVANAQELRPASAEKSLPSLPASPQGIVPFDWNNDLRTDFLVAGREGLRFYEQQKDGSFTDVTARTGLPADVLKGDYFGAWAADVDLDGDLDIILARRAGPPLLLRNNFDGTFTPLPIFPSVDGVRAFAWADLDHDGAPDAALLDSRGYLHVFANERSGQFRKWPVNPPGDAFVALTVADANDDGVLDLIALRPDGVLVRISDRDKRSAWDVAELARWDPVPGALEPGSVRLFAADLDNNGVLDLVASSAIGSRIWLGAAGGKFQALPPDPPPRLFVAADLDGKGRLDLLGLNDNGQPIRLRSKGGKNYHWQAIRPRAAQGEEVKGDNRINSFGIGGEIEVRTGTHVVKQPIAAPVVHFGLGERPRSDVVRIVWPNGTSQAEFQVPGHPIPIDQVFVAEQRLKGSCPFLFSWDGERFVFVTDFMWSTPLGMYIQAQDKGGFLQTTDWVKIRGDHLVPRAGKYEVRVTANLWETHYYDYMALIVVDHPPGTEMFVDERFFLEPTPAAFHLTDAPKPVARAWDHKGQDVTPLVRSIDGVYLDHCGRGTYQGVTNEHWVEVDLGDDAPRQGPVWLVAHGWVHPTDSSINYALEQGKHAPPHGLVLEVPDGKGGWKVGRDRLGFPAGKHKTILIRLDGIDGPGVTRRFRLRTNMEIFWDALQYARGRDDAPVHEEQLIASEAELRYRGILETTRANLSSPELPHYDRIAAQGQFWRDQIGYCTRYGDVSELLNRVDDRYVIMTGGDEIALRFAVPAPPPSGWKRDFVWVCDGWAKDGDLNTRFGKTVLPLPAHDIHSYITPPGRLEDDPVYRRFPRDWEVYHTRYVTPHAYERGLRGFRPKKGTGPLEFKGPVPFFGPRVPRSEPERREP